tara:strand:- start:735 stop:1796 length:1062 start_codon:yes stop_codon:yes gene_type:complete
MRWKFWQRTVSDPNEIKDKPVESSSTRTGVRNVGTALTGLVVLICAIGAWWDSEPKQFDVRATALAHASAKDQQVVTGYITTTTVIELADNLLSKRGGYLSNDLLPPGVWMDNIPEWEFGTLTLLRDTARIYRNDFSRSQSQSTEDPDLAEAEAKFFFDNNSWLLPQTEDQYREGIEYFQAYRDRLANPLEANAQFYARADNLQQWLAAVETRLGSLSQRLSASVGKRQLNTDLAGDTAASQATQSPQEQVVKTPWLQIDNVFYEARGFTFGLIHMLHAIDNDFADVLDKKNARVSLKQIIRELEPTQETLWSPMVLNGDGFGPLANHSLVMASHISRANAAIIDLRTLLTQG